MLAEQRHRRLLTCGKPAKPTSHFSKLATGIPDAHSRGAPILSYILFPHPVTVVAREASVYMCAEWRVRVRVLR